MTLIRRKSRSGPSPLPHGISAGAVLSLELLQRWQERFDTEILDSIGTIEILLIFISQYGSWTRSSNDRDGQNPALHAMGAWRTAPHAYAQHQKRYCHEPPILGEDRGKG